MDFSAPEPAAGTEPTVLADGPARPDEARTTIASYGAPDTDEAKANEPQAREADAENWRNDQTREFSLSDVDHLPTTSSPTPTTTSSTARAADPVSRPLPRVQQADQQQGPPAQQENRWAQQPNFQNNPIPQNGPMPQAGQPSWVGASSYQQPAPGFDWRSSRSGVIRLALGLALVLTVIFKIWVAAKGHSDDYDSDVWSDSDDFTGVRTYDKVFALLCCLGLIGAAVAQLIMLPNVLGQAMKPVPRLMVRVALCAPSFVLIIYTVAKAFEGGDGREIPGFATVLFCAGLGLILAGMDDDWRALPAVPRIAAIVFAAVAALGTVIAFFVLLSKWTEWVDEGGWSAAPWALAPAALLVVAASVTLVIALLRRAPSSQGLVLALATSILVGMLLLEWFEDDEVMLVKGYATAGPVMAFLALALGLATVSVNFPAAGRDDSSQLTAWTSWLTTAYGLAAGAALVEFITFVIAKVLISKVSADDWKDAVDNMSNTPAPLPGSGAVTTALVMFLLAAIAFAACAVLLRTSRLGRVATVGISAVVILVLGILLLASAASTFVGIVSWSLIFGIPVIGICALTMPGAVRRIAGPLLPQSTAAPQPPAGYYNPPANGYGQLQGMPYAPFPAENDGPAPQMREDRGNGQHGNGEGV